MLTSTRSEHVARLRRLHERKGRLRSGSFLAEGPDCVTAALEAGLGIEVVEVVGVEDHPLMDRVLDLGIPFHAATQRVVAAIGDAATPQGIVAQCTLPATTADSVVARRGPIVVCDRISDPGNLGTIIRTAEAVGAAGVATTEGSVDAWNPKV
ncbi:MAG: TrmH family RNA methyltransferase, partial [Actinomycetota bacterium]